MITLNLIDDSAIGWSDSICSGQTPTKVQYVRNGSYDFNRPWLYLNISAYTAPYVDGLRYAWLYESPAIMPHIFSELPKMLDKFDLVFTWNKELCRAWPEKVVWAPAMGVWIGGDPRAGGGGTIGIVPKSKKCSMLLSNKNWTTLQKIRLSVAEQAKKNGVDIYGLGNKFEHVYDGLAEYQYSIAIENAACRDYFTEKLLNCFAVGTIPIYKGCPNIDDYFNVDGIISLDQYMLEPDIIDRKPSSRMLDAVRDNFERVLECVVPEDYIATRYLGQ